MILGRRDKRDPSSRIDDLARAMDLLGADLPTDVTDRVAGLLSTAHERTGLDPSVSLIALVGATGSGKSSLFNALVGTDVAKTGVIRPTTTDAMAAMPQGFESRALLDWLGVPSRQALPADAPVPHDAVLIDLPDIDSISQENRDLARRLAERVDMVIWVLDPQKYADDVIHNQWIAPMGARAASSVAVLTQVDRLAESDRTSVLRDLAGILADDGLPDVPLVATSSVTGEGIEALRHAVRRTAERVRKQNARVQGALDDAVGAVRGALDLDARGDLPAFSAEGLDDSMTALAADVAGVPRIVDAVGRAYRHRAGRECGWMPLRWLRSFRADPLRALHLGEPRPDKATDRDDLVVHSVPAAAQATTAQLSNGVRRVAAQLGEGRPEPWARALSRQAQMATDGATKSLEIAVATTPTTLERAPRWWGWSNAIQWIGWLAVIVGAGWLAAIGLAERFLLVHWDPPMFRAIPWPTLILGAGLLWTLLVVLVSRLCTAVAWRRRAGAVRVALESQVREVIGRDFVEPLVQEDARQREIVGLLKTAG